MNITKIAGLVAAMAMSASLMAAEASDEIKAAAKKLADKGNYSWKTTTSTPGADAGGGGGRGRAFGAGPTEGKTANGVTYLSMTRGENSTEAYVKAGKVAIKTPQGWRGTDELQDADGGGQGRGGGARMIGRMLQNYKTPAEEAQEIAGKVKNLKKEGDAYTGELSADAVKEMFTRGRPNAQGPENAKGSAKFWVKDGVLSKYEVNVQGKMSFQNNDIDINRTTTTEIKEAGATKVEVPEEASKKLS